MKCKNARRAIVLDYYGELPPAEKAGLEEHLRTCRKCGAEREETVRVFSLLEANPPGDIPVPDTGLVWSRIENRLDPKRAPERRPAPAWNIRQWAMAGAALALVLAAGIFIGRRASPLPSPPAASPSSGPVRTTAALKPVLAGHLEDLKPLLLDYANYTPDDAAGATVVIDEEFLRALLFQNVLLRKALAGSDPAAAELLDDCDLILKEIINRDAPAAASPEDIRELIRGRDVLFKLEIIKRT